MTIDITEPGWPSLPTLSDPLFYPQQGSLVPDAVEFQFNPTLKSIDSITVVFDAQANEPKEILLNGPIFILEKGVCFRFASDGLKTVNISGTNHMGVQVSGKVEFVVQGRGASVKTCLPWTGGRVFSLNDPFWKPNTPGDNLPATDNINLSGHWGNDVRFGNAVWLASWTRYATHAIERYAPELLLDTEVPKNELEDICPGYFRTGADDRKKFWALFLASIAYPESGFNPRNRFREPPPLSKWSEGLLQLSVDDHVSHGKMCNFMISPERILNPFDNIRCGVMILKNQISNRRTLWPNTYYYWSVLTTRKSATVRNVFQQNAKRLLPACATR